MERKTKTAGLQWRLTEKEGKGVKTKANLYYGIVRIEEGGKGHRDKRQKRHRVASHEALRYHPQATPKGHPHTYTAPHILSVFLPLPFFLILLSPLQLLPHNLILFFSLLSIPVSPVLSICLVFLNSHFLFLVLQFFPPFPTLSLHCDNLILQPVATQSWQPQKYVWERGWESLCVWDCVCVCVDWMPVGLWCSKLS